jgi:hypothetical protein
MNLGDFSRWKDGEPPKEIWDSDIIKTGDESRWREGLPPILQFGLGFVTVSSQYLLKAILLIARSSDYLFKSTLLKNFEDSYLLKANIRKIIESSYILAGTLLKTVATSYKFTATMLGTIENDYTLDAYLVWIKTGSYILGATLLKTISDTYTFAAVLSKTMATQFLFKATMLKHWNLSYTIKAFLTLALKNLYTMYLMYDVYGALSTGDQQGGSRVIAGPNLLSRVYIYLKDKGSAGSTIVDINVIRAGVTSSIFAAPADRLEVPYNDANNFAEKCVAVKLQKYDVLTVDVDQVATGAEDLSIIMHLDSYTGMKPIVVKFDLLDDTFLLDDKDVWVTDRFKAKIRFENMMDITVMPTVYLIKKDGTKIPLTGSWTSEMVKEDTYITTLVALTEDDVGSAAVSISGARDKYEVTMDEYQKNFVITSIANKLSYSKWSKTASTNVTLGIIAKQFSYSLDDITYTSPIDWDNVVSVDLTNALVGGTVTEETKTVYLKFITGLTSCKKNIDIKYYFSPMAAWTATFQKRIINRTINNEYVSFITLPTTALNMPIQYLRVKQGGVEIAETNKLQTYVASGLTLWFAYASADYELSTDKFTFEDYRYFTSLTGRQTFYSEYVDASNYWYVEKDATNRLHIYVQKGGVPSGEYHSPVLPLSINTWYHFEINRDGITCRMALDGIFQAVTGTTAFAVNLDIGITVQNLYIGRYITGYYFAGYLDEARFSKGICRHTSNFTPTLVELTADEYTYLLLHGNEDKDGGVDGSFVDETGRRVDDVSSGGVTFSSSIKKLGAGSMHFNGTTGYLYTASRLYGITYNNKNLILAIGAGTAILSTGESITKVKTYIELNPLVAASRYDLICLDENGDYIVVEGTEGETRNKPPYINDLSYTITEQTWPEIPFYPESYTPLYAILIKWEPFQGISYVDRNGDFHHFDLRPDSVYIQATLATTEESAEVDAVPLMTGYTSPSGIVTDSTHYSSYYGWHAFDDEVLKWMTQSYTTTGWLAYEFTETVLIGKYIITADTAARAPKNWTFEGWTGAAWVVLDTRVGEIFTVGQEKEYYVGNPGSYIKYRLNITLNGGDTIYLAIRELEFIFSNSNIEVEIEDAAGRTDSKEFFIKLVNEQQNTSTRIVRAYADAGHTIPIVSGEKTNYTKIYLDLVEGF